MLDLEFVKDIVSNNYIFNIERKYFNLNILCFFLKRFTITCTITSNNNNNNFYISSKQYYNYNRIRSLLLLHVHLQI